MATSTKRKLSHPHAKLAQLEDTEEVYVLKSTHSRGSLKESLKPLSSSKHSHESKYSLGHLANVLIKGDRNSMLNAVEKLHGRSRILFELATFSTFSYVRLSAVGNLTNDPEALSDISKFCPYADTRTAALDELSSHHEYLIDVACTSLFKDPRLEAVSLINGANPLSQIAMFSPNIDSRSAALTRLSGDSSVLSKVAQESNYRNTRLEATKRLSHNMQLLCALMLSTRHLDVKKYAATLLAEFVESITDPEVLIELAKICSSQDSRYLAVGKLWKNPAALRKVAEGSKYKDSRSTAMMLLSDMVGSIDEPELLAEVATASPYEDCRAAAIERLVGVSSALLSVASKSKYKDARDLAVDKLKSDVDTLKDVMRMSKYKDTRAAAHKIVSNPATFQHHLSKILG